MESHNYDSFLGLQRSKQTVLEAPAERSFMQCYSMHCEAELSGNLGPSGCRCAGGYTSTGIVYEDTDSVHVRELQLSFGISDSGMFGVFARIAAATRA